MHQRTTRSVAFVLQHSLPFLSEQVHSPGPGLQNGQVDLDQPSGVAAATARHGREEHRGRDRAAQDDDRQPQPHVQPRRGDQGGPPGTTAAGNVECYFSRVKILKLN